MGRVLPPLGLERRRCHACHDEHVRDVRGDDLRAFFAFARRAPMQLRGARQHGLDRVAGLVEDDAVADRQWLLLVGPRLEQLAEQRQLAAFPADLDVADLGVDA